MSNTKNSSGALQPYKYKLKPYQLDSLLQRFYEDLDVDSSFYIPRLQGRILTTIESIGLPEKQEKSLKGIVKTFFNQTLTEMADRKVETYRHIRDTFYENKVLLRPDNDIDLAVTLFGQKRDHYMLVDEVDNPDK